MARVGTSGRPRTTPLHPISGSEIRAVREALGLTQTALARALDATQNTIARWESGEMTVRHPGMLRLALEALVMRQTHDTGRRG